MAGVNQRSRYPPSSGHRKAVSDKFISPATACIQSAAADPVIGHTAAGLPAKGSPVKASTW